MALIEGVGDEVTLLFGLLLVLMVLVLAWASTHTAETAESIFSPPTAASASSSLEQHATLAATTTTTTTTVSSDAGSQTLAPPPGEEGKTDGVEGERSAGGGNGGEGGAADAAGEGEEAGEDGGERSVLGDGLRRREAVAPQETGGEGQGQRNMVVRLKFLNDTERLAQVEPQDTIGYIKRTYFAGQEHQVRLIYQGQLLQNDAQTLASLNLAHNCVLHCHISQHAARSTPVGAPPTHQVQVALNVGSLMVPLFLLMLSVLWYCQIQYRHFFTAPATASLVGVTIFFSLVAFSVYRR
ncbi:transmembrane and ubiquitin-like domain-containing protein 1 [Gadus macrocephalus]|uniref:transmembrane and ubiquitin-like domain-containing protein 1 n=1 Tax=Gadus macrocephalus TaxID=80720 RepID=UPI0028CB9D7B|nr:transmembrane and ubiquitin-like domain-containing protein 1 [Gadus macrocephalus]